MAIPFWVLGHVHLHFANYHDAWEYTASMLMHLMVGVGFWLDWKQSQKKTWQRAPHSVYSIVLGDNTHETSNDRRRTERLF